MKLLFQVAALNGIMLFMASFAWGDGPTRPIRPDEINFFRRVQPVLLSVMAAAPSGWTASDVPHLETPKFVSEGQESYPLSESIRAQWVDPVKRDEFNAGLEELSGRTAAAWSAPDPVRDKLTVELERLGTELGEALNRQDMEAVTRIQGELEAVQNDLTKIFDARQNVLDAQLRATQPRDSVLEVDVDLNSFNNTFYLGEEKEPGFTSEPSIAGAMVVRIEDEGFTDNTWREGLTVALLGPGEIKQEGGTISLTTASDNSVAYTKVQNIVVRVRAEKNRARTFLEAIDWPALRGLMD